MLRFIHTSDLHLGRTFRGRPPDLAEQLAEARFDCIGRLAGAARSHGYATVLLSGDTWDSELASDRVLRQSLDRFAEQSDIRWGLLPGNHDPLSAGGLWDRVAAVAVPNLHLLLTPEPVELAPGGWILPAPCNRPGGPEDPTEWMADARTPEGAVRIGLAHGSVRDFSSDGSGGIIAPDLAERAGLDYLALGDWHGWTAFGPRTLYSGTPEPDKFREGSGHASAVSIAGPGAVPDIRKWPVARFYWCEVDLDISVEPDADAALTAGLPADVARRDVLLSLRLSGSVRPQARADWTRAVGDLRLSLAELRLDDSALQTLMEADDLDLIDRQGALREAANALKAASTDDAQTAEERAVAARALDLLFTWAQDAGQAR
ncbi:MAG: DNA repair exonuclease [Pseudomonadota bacterium]